METLAIGLWGCFFGGSFLVLCGAIFAYSRSLHRIGINTALLAIGPAFAVTAFLGGLPIDDQDTLMRLIAHLTALVGSLLVYQMLVVLGSLQVESNRQRTRILFALVALISISVSWMFTPYGALLMCSLVAFALALFAWGMSVRKALLGDAAAWVTAVAVTVVISACSGLSYAMLHPENSSWGLQVFCAASATGYVLALAVINAMRYTYLLERKKVMEYGPAYDPITQLRSRSETSQMARDIFNSQSWKAEPLGMLVVTITNLYVLEKLHGTAALNSALFVLAARLKRSLPVNVELGRIGFDGFLLIMRNCADSSNLIALAQDLNLSLHRPALLKTNPAVRHLESAQTQWAALAGIGVLQLKNPDISYLEAITMARNLSHVASSYKSRLAWFDHASGEMAELAGQKDSD